MATVKPFTLRLYTSTQGFLPWLPWLPDSIIKHTFEHDVEAVELIPTKLYIMMQENALHILISLFNPVNLSLTSDLKAL